MPAATGPASPATHQPEAFASNSTWPVLHDLVARPGGHRNAGAGGELQ